MTSSKSSPKRSIKSYFEEITTFDLFYQLTYMSATASAGISRARAFQLARELAAPPAEYFKGIHQLAENLRYNYPDAVRLVGEKARAEDVKNFLLRLSDALRSGEPLPGFLMREAEVQGEHYQNDYTRNLESLKKWTDAYTSVTVSAALIVIINMVSTMIHDFGPMVMVIMIMVAIGASFGVAWLIFRAGPQETKSVPLAKGSKVQRQSQQLLLLLLPTCIVLCGALLVLGVDKAYVLILAALVIFPVGLYSYRADEQVDKKDSEISSFLRSLGGTATSRGTTLRDALASMKIDSFPALQKDIYNLDLRLKAFGKPSLCWETFGRETGSLLAKQAIGIFYQAVNLGSDPERAGKVTSMFAMKTAMLRAQRRGVAATFTYLIVVLHIVMAGLMVFLLGVLQQFGIRLNDAMNGLGGQGSDALGSMGLGSMFAFGAPQIQFQTYTTVAMIILLAVINSFAIVASEGSHLIKITFYLSILLFLSGLALIGVPPLVKMVM
jgi:archaeal flagellar protein FlaJ